MYDKHQSSLWLMKQHIFTVIVVDTVLFFYGLASCLQDHGQRRSNNKNGKYIRVACNMQNEYVKVLRIRTINLKSHRYDHILKNHIQNLIAPLLCNK